MIAVENNGGSIEPKYLQDIWNLFFTTKQSRSGIGLSEARKFIASMDGSIDLTSTYGEGTCVSLSLKKPPELDSAFGYQEVVVRKNIIDTISY